jgi:hypothetical protein
MAKVKTRNKWDKTSPVEKKVEKVFKIISIVIFLSIWTPAFFYIMNELVKYLF